MDCVILTPIGPIEIVEDGNSITRVTYRENALKKSATTSLLKEAVTQLEEYFSGNRTEFSLPLMINEPPFIKKVLENLPELVPYGSTISYGKIAEKVGLPKASRAVGSAMQRNPFVIVIPCHRVILSGGQLGNYSAGGEKNKRYLLELEGLTIGS